MERKMRSSRDRKHGNHGHLSLVGGERDAKGRRRSIRHTREEIALKDEKQQRFMRLVSEHGTISRAIGEIAAGNQTLGTSEARRILELRAAGFTAEQREEIVYGDSLRWNRALDSQRKPAA